MSITCCYLDDNKARSGSGSHKQTCTFGSTIKVEYIASFVATKEVVWLHHLLSCLGHPQLNPTLLLSNNQSYIHLVYNPEFPRCIKHIDIQFHIVQEKQLIGEINMFYVSFEHQIVDIFTKGLLAIKFQRLGSLLKDLL
ncbi:hypothetical protein BDL97_01G139700 [Sphagnum fallax]|nr:hypothetical protein BDL97_01G139700 [Sphagnum fallax]